MNTKKVLPVYPKKINILGTRGIPARHGGFETFAERLSLYLVARNWDVTVYCQEDGTGQRHDDRWNGVRRVHLPISQQGAKGTIIFDWKSTLAASKDGGLMLVLGYNTALFSIVHRLRRRTVLMNMDGVEWKRQKWSAPEKAWLYVNERIGSLLSTHLIADHPEIKKHLVRHTDENKITMIPYGADLVKDGKREAVEKLGLEPGRYCIVIARPEPENSILEIVSAFSRKKRDCTLVVLGRFDPDKNRYHREILKRAGSEIVFPGAIYEKDQIEALRFHCLLYVHGHSIGGTNPSLVEALGSGSPVLAHDNRFNRWVAGEGARFFKNEYSCARMFDEMLDDRRLLDTMRAGSLKRYREEFTWGKILASYEAILLRHL